MRNLAGSVVIMVLLASCATTGTSIQRLTGRWEYADAKQRCEYQFDSDGTFRGTVSLAGKLVSQFTGHWRVEGDRLMYLYTGDALGRIPVGATDEDKLLRVAQDQFEIQAADGSRRTYRRLR